MSTVKTVSPASIVSPRVQGDAVRDRMSVELGAVGAAQVAEIAGGAVGLQGEVHARHLPIVGDGEIGPFGAADLERLAGVEQAFRPALGPEMILSITRIVQCAWHDLRAWRRFWSVHQDIRPFKDHGPGGLGGDLAGCR